MSDGSASLSGSSSLSGWAVGSVLSGGTWRPGRTVGAAGRLWAAVTLAGFFLLTDGEGFATGYIDHIVPGIVRIALKGIITVTPKASYLEVLHLDEGLIVEVINIVDDESHVEQTAEDDDPRETGK